MTFLLRINRPAEGSVLLCSWAGRRSWWSSGTRSGGIFFYQRLLRTNFAEQTVPICRRCKLEELGGRLQCRYEPANIVYGLSEWSSSSQKTHSVFVMQGPVPGLGMGPGPGPQQQPPWSSQQQGPPQLLQQQQQRFPGPPQSMRPPQGFPGQQVPGLPQAVQPSVPGSRPDGYGLPMAVSVRASECFAGVIAGIKRVNS